MQSTLNSKKNTTNVFDNVGLEDLSKMGMLPSPSHLQICKLVKEVNFTPAIPIVTYHVGLKMPNMEVFEDLPQNRGSIIADFTDYVESIFPQDWDERLTLSNIVRKFNSCEERETRECRTKDKIFAFRDLKTVTVVRDDSKPSESVVYECDKNPTNPRHYKLDFTIHFSEIMKGGM